MQLLPDFHPNAARIGACYLCNAGRRGDGDAKERVVDLGVSIDMEGFLQICETCGREIGELVGLVDPAELEKTRDALAVANSECQELREQVAEARQLVALIRGYDEHQPREVLSAADPLAGQRAKPRAKATAAR